MPPGIITSYSCTGTPVQYWRCTRFSADLRFTPTTVSFERGEVFVSTSGSRSNMGRLGTRTEFDVRASMSVRYTDICLSSRTPVSVSARTARTSRRARVFSLCHVPFSVGIDSLLVRPFRVIYCVVILHCTRSLASFRGDSRAIEVCSAFCNAPMYRRSAANGSESTYSCIGQVQLGTRGLGVKAAPI